MTLKAHEQHVLNAIDDVLASSDPKLSSKLAIFNRLTAGEALPALEQIQPAGHPCRGLAWPLLWLAICIAMIGAALAIGHMGGTAACPVRPAACAWHVIPGTW